MVEFDDLVKGDIKRTLNSIRKSAMSIISIIQDAELDLEDEDFDQDDLDELVGYLETDSESIATALNGLEVE